MSYCMLLHGCEHHVVVREQQNNVQKGYKDIPAMERIDTLTLRMVAEYGTKTAERKAL